MIKIDPLLQAYNDPVIVSDYARAEDLTACEKALFDRHIPADAQILDLGVGGGRTAPHLAGRAGLYTGVDYSPAMIAACKTRYPDLTFLVANAASLERIPAASFDVVVFSFNGIDSLQSDAERGACFGEIYKVLKSGGVFIFSSHNARKLHRMELKGAKPHQIAWRTIRWLLANAERIASPTFWLGYGYRAKLVNRRARLRNYVSTPAVMRHALASGGFIRLETLPSTHPAAALFWDVDWYYYAARKV